jgi:hypothetical protein
MCEVRFRKKIAEQTPKYIYIVVGSEKKWTVMNPN